MGSHPETQNITLTVPFGTTILNHSDPHLICRPSRWTDLAAFYLGNYIAHVATVRSTPGELLPSLVWTLYCVLIAPTVGVARGIDAIRSFTVYHILKGDYLRAAARAGALCMVVRDMDWKPAARHTHELSHCILSPEDLAEQRDTFEISNEERNAVANGDVEMQLVPPTNRPSGPHRFTLYRPSWAIGARGIFLELTRNIHGAYRLPPGYTFTRVPVDAEVDFLDLKPLGPATATTEIRSTEDIVYSWSFIKALVSVLQLLYAISSLYRSKGNQIDVYGYAAFGLTVAPYAVMSFINLLGTLVAVEFPKLYMVDSPIMQEALERGGSFAGVVGKLRPPNPVPAPEGFDFVKGQLEGDHDGTGVLVIEREPHGNLKPDGHEAAVLPEVNIAAVPDADHPRPQEELKPRAGIVAVPTCLPFARAKDFRQRLPGPARRGCVADILEPADWRLMPEGAPLNLPNRQNSNLLRALRLADDSIGFAGWIVGFYIPPIASLAIVGGLSRWRKGGSTLPQRVWTMMWLVFGFVLNLRMFQMMDREDLPTQLRRGMTRGEHWGHRALKWALRKIVKDEPDFEAKIERLPIRTLDIWMILFYSAPAFGGLVVVGQMLSDYGACFKIF